MSVAPPPPGFEPYSPFAPKPRGTLSMRPTSPPPPGFTVDVTPGTDPHDGDTFRAGGQNARLYGADAFELNQTGTRGGIQVPLGVQPNRRSVPI